MKFEGIGPVRSLFAALKSHKFLAFSKVGSGPVISSRPFCSRILNSFKLGRWLNWDGISPLNRLCPTIKVVMCSRCPTSVGICPDNLFSKA